MRKGRDKGREERVKEEGEMGENKEGSREGGNERRYREVGKKSVRKGREGGGEEAKL